MTDRSPTVQVICLHWWGMLQLANARLRTHFFTASEPELRAGFQLTKVNRCVSFNSLNTL